MHNQKVIQVDKKIVPDLPQQIFCPVNYIAIEWLSQLGCCAPTEAQIEQFEALFKAIVLNNFKVTAGLRGLTNREKELLSCLIQGIPTKKIVDILGIRERTIRYHKKNIIRKTNCKSISQAIYKLIVPYI